MARRRLSTGKYGVLVLEMAVFGVFLARRAIVCSHGRKPVEKIGPITQSPRRGRQNSSTAMSAKRRGDDEDD